MFYYKIRKIFKITYFEEHLQTTVSALGLTVFTLGKYLLNANKNVYIQQCSRSCLTFQKESPGPVRQKRCSWNFCKNQRKNTWVSLLCNKDAGCRLIFISISLIAQLLLLTFPIDEDILQIPDIQKLPKHQHQEAGKTS